MQIILMDADHAPTIETEMAWPMSGLFWLPDQRAPFASDQPPAYSAIFAVEAGASDAPPAMRYEADLVVGKDGPPGGIAIAALIERRPDITQAEAIRHWDEHIPLAREVHHKACRYHQYRFRAALSVDAPRFIGLAILSFHTPDDLRTGLFRNADDMRLIDEDIAEFISNSTTMIVSEHRLGG